MECFKCGVSGERALLFDMISNKGIVKVCRKCSFEEDLPIIRKSSELDSGGVERQQTVRERLSRMTGFNSPKEVDLKSVVQNENLRKLVDRNVVDKALYSKKMGNLADNFHWAIMRARRSKKLTQAQFAESIGESEVSVKLSEKGVISEGAYEFVKKLENSLGIRILKEESPTSSFDEEKEKVKQDLIEKIKKDEFEFDDVTTKTLTISDLNELKKKREAEIFEEPEYMINKNAENDEPEFLWDKKDLSDDELDDIIFGRK